MPRNELLRPLPQLLAEHSRTHGAGVAFSDETVTLTYADLRTRTAALAAAFARAGLGRGDRAALCLGNGAVMAESYVAVLRASAVSVPIDPVATVEQIAHILDDAGVRLLVTDTAQYRRLANVLKRRPGTEVVLTDAPAAGGGAHAYAELAVAEGAAPRDDLGLDEPAWILYTSGTSGVPKGVVSSQRNALWNIAACYAPLVGLSRDDRLLWPLPLFHTLGHNLGVVGVLATGASAHYLDGFVAEEVLARLVAGHHTLLPGVPTYFRQLVRSAEGAPVQAPELRVCLTGGAVAPADLREDVERVLGAPTGHLWLDRPCRLTPRSSDAPTLSPFPTSDL